MKCLIVFLCMLVAAGAASGATLEDPYPKVASSYLLLVDGKSTWAHRPKLRLPPASLTKIMTALLVLERGELEQVVTVSRSAAQESGTRIGLRRGDRLLVRDLLAATLIHSANDACRALADHAGGNRERFILLMNARARSLGLADTSFNDPCGHDQPGHYSTAHDLAILAETALKHPLFTELVARQGLLIQTVEGKRHFRLRSKNRLLGHYPGMAGVKTGYTEGAGRCLIALAERGERRALLVMLRTRNRWHDAAAMLDRAFLLEMRPAFGNRSSAGQ